MRLPVSTTDRECPCGGVLFRVVGCSVLPCSPQDSQPSASEDADSVCVLAAALAGSAIDERGPRAGVAGVIGEAGDGSTQPLVAGPSPADASRSSALVGDGSDAGLGGEVILALEAGALVTELGSDLRSADFAGARERHDDAALGQLGDGMRLVSLASWATMLSSDRASARTISPLASASASPATPHAAERNLVSTSAAARLPQYWF